MAVLVAVSKILSMPLKEDSFAHNQGCFSLLDAELWGFVHSFRLGWLAGGVSKAHCENLVYYT